MSTLFSIYLACTIFGVGVTIVDMLGILGDLFHEGDEGADGHLDDTEDGGDSEDFDGDHGDADDGDHGGEYDDASHDGDHGEAHDHGEHGEKGSVSSHENYQERHILLRMLSTARSLVHFSLGFGPVGIFALATGRGASLSLAWSVPVGVVAMISGRLLRRLQRSELDSQFTAEDLIMERGEVLVSIGKGQLGKVRIRMEGSYAERFARAKDPAQRFPVGAKIRVVDVSDECVYVEEE